MLRFLIGLSVLLSACSPSAETTQALPQSSSTPNISLTTAQKAKIGQKIWQNECGGTRDGLTTWNDGENFPSLGIGHFIWYPAGVQGPFTESFPQFAAFARQRGVQLPALAQHQDAPWSSKAAFTSQFRSPATNELRNWLANSVPLQTDFIIYKSQLALKKILAATSPADRARVRANYYKTATTPNGAYALIDYVNFKGEGTNPKERYKDQGWGLAQVLAGMRNVNSGQAAAQEFSAAAKRALSRRISNAPRDESRWKAGWHNRCDTYARSL